MLDRVNKAYNSRVRKITTTIGHADLTAAATTQAIAASSALPPGAQILGVNMRDYTPFTGGSISAVALDVGVTGGDVDAIVDGADVFAAAVDGQVASVTAGIAPFKRFAAATTLAFLFTASHNVSTATAGAVTIDVLYNVPDESLPS